MTLPRGRPTPKVWGNLLGSPESMAKGIEHVSRADPKIRELVRRIGVVEIRPRGRPFDSLVRSVLSQQLNGSAAEKITSRTYELFLPGRLTPEGVLAIPTTRLRGAGVSPQKAVYLKDLAARIVDGRLDLSRIGAKDDEEIIRAMDEVKGVGRWTAQMFLIFSLGRPDVLPVDDFGLKTAIERVYGLRGLPRARRIEEIAEPWHPFSTVACIYLWRSRGVV